MKNYRLLPLLSSILLTLQVYAQTYTSPPATPVRTMAEWEEVQTLVVTWNGGSGGNIWLNILTEIIRAARLECKVRVICMDQATVVSARNYLILKNVDVSSNVEFVVAPNDSIWIRDYGPQCVYANGVDTLFLIDWIYNRTRYLDDVVPQVLGEKMQIPVYSTTQAPYDLVNTGGNFMSDGMGQAFASKLIFRNNDTIANGEGNNMNDTFGITNHTEASINNIMQEYMGIDRFIKMNELPYDGIHHIDMHMKLLDEETLLVGEYPANTSDGPQIEANLQYVLSLYKTSFGHDFKVVRIPMPPFQNGPYPPFTGLPALYPTYTNAVFVNKTIIMPKYGIPLDEAARDTFLKYLPGYNVVQVNCNNLIEKGGAVHCITKEIGVADPLLILHSALPCQENNQGTSYEVYATLRHRSGITGAKVFYTTDLSAPWQSDVMEHVVGDTSFLWKGDIPQQAAGSTVYYYIEANAVNGKTLTRPITAPAGYWSFCVTQGSDTEDLPTVRMGNIYPNPASGLMVIPMDARRKTEADIRILNPLGEYIATVYKGTMQAKRNNYFFDASTLGSGVYFVVVDADGIRTAQKLIVKNER